MDLKQQYAAKLTAPEEAVQVVRSGDWIDYGWCIWRAGFTGSGTGCPLSESMGRESARRRFDGPAGQSCPSPIPPSISPGIPGTWAVWRGK